MDEQVKSERSVERRFTLGGAALTLLELALIFGVFAAYGAWPVPDVNEQYYVGKAIHFWNHDWLGNDPFLNTPDSHWLFYAVFGLLSLVFKQNALVWVGRSVVWLATACAWLRLSRAFFPKRWIALLTAAAFAFYLESFHLAGEWIIGGIEGKGLAFPFVFWGLACFIEGKYNRAWILYGIGSAFHVLVGGWAVLASLIAWTLDSLRFADSVAAQTFFARLRARFAGLWRAARRTAPGLLLGGAVSLLGLVPALRLDLGATAAEIAESRRIYVFERLSHHLVASSLPWTFLVRFAALILCFVLAAVLASLLRRLLRLRDCEVSTRCFRLYAFVSAAILFACIGAAIDWGSKYLESVGTIEDHKSAAGLLRYYWYRLSDWAVPLGLVFASFQAIGLSIRLLRARFARGGSDAFSACAASLSCWLGAGFGAYWTVRHVFYNAAVRVARASAVDGLVPLPKPTEAASFTVAAAALGLALTLCLALAAWLVVRRARKENGNKETFAPVWILTGVCAWLCVVTSCAPCWRLASFVDLRGTKVIPRSAPPKESIADGWLDACHWCRDNTPEKAIFLVPRGCDSFKWEAKRAEAGSWKEIPQDAKSIVKWSRKMERFYANPGADPNSPLRWNQPLVGVFINKGRDLVVKEAEKFGYQYAIVETPPYVIATIPEALKRWKEFEKNDLVYQNDQFFVLKLIKDGEDAENDKTTN